MYGNLLLLAVALGLSTLAAQVIPGSRQLSSMPDNLRLLPSESGQKHSSASPIIKRSAAYQDGKLDELVSNLKQAAVPTPVEVQGRVLEIFEPELRIDRSTLSTSITPEGNIATRFEYRIENYLGETVRRSFEGEWTPEHSEVLLNTDLFLGYE